MKSPTMKSMNIKVTGFLFFYFLIAFFLILGVSNIIVLPPETIPFIGTFICKGAPQNILPIFQSNYTVNNAFLLYFMIYPSLEITGILIAYSWVFAKYRDDEEDMHESMLVYLRSVLGIVMVCLVLSVIATELVRPMLLSKQTSIQNTSNDFQEFSEMAKKSTAAGAYDLAELYANQALSIDPTSKETIELLRLNELESSRLEAHTGESFDTGDNFPGPEINIPVKELLKRANEAYLAGKYFDAHYYATLVQKTFKLDLSEKTDAGLGSADYTAASQIAADAWKKLQVTDSTLGGLSEAMYALKMQGYSAILAGNYVYAYYVFKEMLNATGGDPDIRRYLQIAQEQLESQYFFIDETLNLQPFESVRNVLFSVKKKDGGRYIIGIRGIFSASAEGNPLHYLRGFHVISYSAANVLVEDFYVPYAKLIAEPAASFGPDYSNLVKKRWNKTVPYVQLNAVDRNNKDVSVKPVYYTNETSALGGQTNVLVLPMPYADFQLITEASQGADHMSLDSLALFCRKAAAYGFSWEAFFQSLCSRLCNPFLFIVLALTVAIIAWKFRISKNQMVRLWWFLLIPCFSGCIYYLMTICDYYHNMLIYAILGAAGWLVLPIVIALYLFFFAILCLFFTSIKDD